MKILMIILAFNFILIIHELGHFIVAKLSKIKVEEFSLFIGPKLFSITRGETTYSIRLFPVLAYVKMEGEDEESASENAFYKKPVWVRAAVIAAGPLANIISALIIITIYYSISGYQTMNVSEISQNSAAYNAGLEVGDKIVEYDNKRVYQPLDVIQFLYISKGKPAEVKVSRNGEIYNLTMEPEIIPSEKRFMLGFSASDQESNLVGTVTKGGPGDQGGLKSGDRIVELNDTEVKNIDEIRKFLNKNKNNPLKMTVERSGELIVLNATPEETTTTEQYAVGFNFGYAKGDIFASMKQGALFAYCNTRNVAYALAWLFTGKATIGEMMGPVGIVSTMNEAVQSTPTMMDAILTILNLTAFISVAVGATNLIPFPALDGSKLVILAIEAVRRKPIPIEKEAIITTIGFFILIGFSIFVSINDVARLFGFSF
ncbi:RIP metalloprotease RseP [Acetivibrio cellulolyticus]|uniref:RIP metalloprotease RseP n=1 Tax=Acetivibrio cellulolyticus TaxID=35830 RepID=UPI0001E2C261|nr:RIP metalloprotease RseP [Acetivibrio cellulolyticus]